MHLAFALPTRAHTGNGGGADFIEGLAGGLRELGAQVELLRGDAPDFPPGARPIIDGMLLPALHARLDELVERDGVALIHHAGAAAGRDDASRAQVATALQDILPRLSHVFATSAPVAERLRESFGVTAHVLTPGFEPVERAAPDPAAPLILSVGVLTRRKGHDRLLRAAARLIDLPWRLVIAGDTNREPDFAAELQSLAIELGLADRVAIIADPSPEALEPLWRQATVFALATTWEGFPTTILSAMARGIPVLTTDAANAAPLLPASAGLICPADDMATFGKCLRRLLFDDGLRAEMAVAARSAGSTLPRWSDRARDFNRMLERTV